jgi:hypothetical protein
MSITDYSERAANWRLRLDALPYLEDLGLTGERVRFRVGYYRSDTHGCIEWYPTRQGRPDRRCGYTIYVQARTANRTRSRLRTLAHECWHLHELVNGIPASESAAERYAARATRPYPSPNTRDTGDAPA